MEQFVISDNQSNNMNRLRVNLPKDLADSKIIVIDPERDFAVSGQKGITILIMNLITPNTDYLQVTLNDIKDSGLTVDSFSDFSKKNPNVPGIFYISNDYGDRQKFLVGLKKNGCKFTIRDIESNLPILEYPMIFQK